MQLRAEHLPNFMFIPHLLLLPSPTLVCLHPQKDQAELVGGSWAWCPPQQLSSEDPGGRTQLAIRLLSTAASTVCAWGRTGQHQHLGACSAQSTRRASSREEPPWCRECREGTPLTRHCSVLHAEPCQANTDMGRRCPADQDHDPCRVPLPWPQIAGSCGWWARRCPSALLHSSETSASHMGRRRPALGCPHVDPARHQRELTSPCPRLDAAVCALGPADSHV